MHRIYTLIQTLLHCNLLYVDRIHSLEYFSIMLLCLQLNQSNLFKFSFNSLLGIKNKCGHMKKKVIKVVHTSRHEMEKTNYYQGLVEFLGILRIMEKY